MKSNKEKWIIEVVDWGTLHLIGTEEQAEEMRQHKANWELTIAKKHRASINEIKEYKGKWELLDDLLN